MARSRIKQLGRLAAVAVSSANRKQPARQSPGDGPCITTTASVTREQVVTFAKFLGVQGPEVEGSPMVPPGLLHALCFEPSVEVLADRRLPVSLLGLVVTGQSWRLLRPVKTGDRLDIQVRVGGVHEDSAGTHLELLCSVWLADERAVNEGFSCRTAANKRCLPRLCYQEAVSYLSRRTRRGAESVGQEKQRELEREGWQDSPSSREEREGQQGLPGAAGRELRDNEASNAAHGKQEDHSGRAGRVNMSGLPGNENQKVREELAGGDAVEKQGDRPAGTAREMQESDDGGSAPPVLLPVPDARSRYGINSAGRLDVGQWPQIARRAFSIADSRHWARLTGDVNPIHMSTTSARLFGFRRAILHGAALDAWAATQAGIDGRTPCAGAAYFRAPVMLPANVELVPLGTHAAQSERHGSATNVRIDYAVLDERSGRDLVHLCYAVLTEATRDSALDVSQTTAPKMANPVTDAQGLPPQRASAAPADQTPGALSHGCCVSPHQLFLPRENGRLTSTAVARGMCLAATGDHPELRELIAAADPWRHTYRDAMTALTAYDAPQIGVQAARRGLDFVAATIRTGDGRTIGEVTMRDVGPGAVIAGSASTVADTALPRWCGDGETFLAQLGQWREAGRLRAAAADALGELALAPVPPDLSAWTFVCLGVSAELSPARMLLAWGARVAAVGRPGSAGLTVLADYARTTAGTLFLPPSGVGDVVGDPGAIAGWAARLPGRLVVVDTLYAPGSQFLLAAAGADAVERLLVEARPDTALAWYGTPTDAYLLPDLAPRTRFGTGVLAQAVTAYAKVRRLKPARRLYTTGHGGATQGFNDALYNGIQRGAYAACSDGDSAPSGSVRTYSADGDPAPSGSARTCSADGDPAPSGSARTYSADGDPAHVSAAHTSSEGDVHGAHGSNVYSGFIDVQGPNYAAAKRIGRWRATVEQAAGRVISYNIGPLARTESVLSSGPLRAAYAGLERLGMPPLDAETAAELMAGLLVWDLTHPAPTTPDFLTDKAIDCGLFTSPYRPNDLMAAAVLLGADGLARGRGTRGRRGQ